MFKPSQWTIACCSELPTTALTTRLATLLLNPSLVSHAREPRRSVGREPGQHALDRAGRVRHLHGVCLRRPLPNLLRFLHVHVVSFDQPPFSASFDSEMKPHNPVRPARQVLYQSRLWDIRPVGVLRLRHCLALGLKWSTHSKISTNLSATRDKFGTSGLAAVSGGGVLIYIYHWNSL